LNIAEWGKKNQVCILYRSAYALKMAWQHRKALGFYRRDPVLQRVCLRDIDPQVLSARGIQALALDFDGVLASHGELKVHPEIESCITQFIQHFGVERIFVLSNKPSPARAEYFAAHYPGIRWIFAARKKPYPDGIQEILAITGLDAQQLMVFDDRLLTGILAALIAKTSACYITEPYIDLSKRPLAELFFMGLRKLERFLCLVV
jgi:uncharacterized protein